MTSDPIVEVLGPGKGNYIHLCDKISMWCCHLFAKCRSLMSMVPGTGFNPYYITYDETAYNPTQKNVYIQASRDKMPLKQTGPNISRFPRAF